MSKPAKSSTRSSGFTTSIPRCVIVALLILGGIAWMIVYTHVAMDAANFTKAMAKIPGVDKPDDPLPWMSDMGRWNYLIGFGLIFLGLTISAHPTTPLGRGRGVVIGMLGCFLLGLLWIVTFYFVGQETSFHLPVMDQLDQSNLLVGVGFMAVGFTFATKWE